MEPVELEEMLHHLVNAAIKIADNVETIATILVELKEEHDDED